MKFKFLLLFFILLASNQSSVAETKKPYAIVSAHPLASQAGEQILDAGGNAFDAAVAISAALAVVEPQGSGLGGGGFWLLHDAASGKDIVIDGREVAPLAAHAKMYLDADGKLTRKSIDGPLAAGIPGMVAALDVINNNFGNLTLQQSLQPAIDIAQTGFGKHKNPAGAMQKQCSLMLRSLSGYFAALEQQVDPAAVPLAALEHCQTASFPLTH